VDVGGDRQAEGILLALLGSLHAMTGAFERARELAEQGRALLEELGLAVEVARARQEAWRVEMLAGDVAGAERHIRAAYDALTALGEKYLLSTVAGLLAQTLYVRGGALDEIAALGQLARELATEDDVDTQALWRCVQGKHLARSGDVAGGELLVRQALELLEPTDAVLFKLGAQLDLAEVHGLAGPDATAALATARGLAAEKRSPVLVAQVDALRAAAAREPLAST
jgi:hypothetical protein